MIYGDNPQKINEREDMLGLTTYSYAPSISAIAQTGNLYVYCLNNPVNRLDYTGEDAIWLQYPREINSLDDILEMIGNGPWTENELEIATDGLEDYLYMKGDFSGAFDYLRGLENKKYFLTARNCVQTCVEALKLVTPDDDGLRYNRLLTELSGIIKPNKAYKWFNFWAKTEEPRDR